MDEAVRAPIPMPPIPPQPPRPMKASALLVAAAALLFPMGATANAQVSGAVGGPFGTILALSAPQFCTLASTCTLGPGVGTIVGGNTRFAHVTALAWRPTGTEGNFLAAGPLAGGNNGSAVLTFTAPVDGFGFLWGSADTYNTLKITTSNNVTTNFLASNLGLSSGSDQYVRFTADAGYTITQVEFESSANAFEVANFTTTVPEPSTYLMMATGLLAVGVTARRRRALAAAAAAAAAA